MRDLSDPGDPWLTGVLREAFSPLANEDRWQLAAVAIAGDRTGAWLSGASIASAFQIGSVTKTFTALLLATMTAKGQVALEDPVGRYLPAAAGSGTRLLDLATHTSGYPRIPRGIKARMLLRLRDPYALVRDRDVDRSLRKLSRNLAPARTRSNTPTSATACCHERWRRPLDSPSASCYASRCCGPSTSGR